MTANNNSMGQEGLIALIKQARERIEALEAGRGEALAVVGIGCRFPGQADSPARFWENLLNGVDGVGPVPAGRWQDASSASELAGGFIEDVDQFDAPFFHISEREARYIDPQQRLLLQTAWHALEDAA